MTHWISKNKSWLRELYESVVRPEISFKEFCIRQYYNEVLIEDFN